MKQIQDHYFKKAQKEGYPARSVYKLEEAQDKYRFLKNGDKVLDLGCQPGSWSMYAGQIVGPTGLIVGIDLHGGRVNRKGQSAEIKVLKGDIYNIESLDALKEICPEYSAVISDMAPHTTGNKWSDQQQSINLSRRALELADMLLTEGGSFYCKVFEGEDFKEFVDNVRKFFKKVQVVKPKSSRKESREVFILGLGFFRQ
ncbi:MAG: RlmE family RNA methyltransferase [Proteobacteria bacterium]|nr:RlmE family RNA methyltransferase [Pseudomonadota bacterium]